ncbi:MAG TPA: hypothetical protein DD766_03715 [Desulfovibrio sp.]|nr:hypothetical protein [Desulfovibrio sp.]
MEIASILSSSQSTTLASLFAANRQQDDQRTDLASMLLSENDTDADGFLSSKEMGLSDTQLAKFDTDGDGLMSQAELKSMLEQHAFLGKLQTQMSGNGEGPEAQMASDLIDTYDSDGDGSLSAEELGMTASELAAYDTDGDGLLNSEELVSGLKADKEAMMAQSAPPPPPPGETDADLASTILADLDSDGDGSLSLAELGTDSPFAEFDADGDGLVSEAELTSGLAAQRADMMAEMNAASSTDSAEEASTTVASSDSAGAASGGSGGGAETDPMDTNKDGVVSTEEYEAWMAEHGFTLGTDSGDSGSDSSIRSLLAKAMEAYQNQSNAFANVFLGQGNLVDQGLFSSSGLGLSASA